MKKIISTILLLMLTLALFSCGNDSGVPDGMQKASEDDVAYSLFIPGGWVLLDGENGLNGAYYSASDKSSITVSSYYGDVYSIDEYWQKSKASYEETYKNFTVETEEEQVVFGGKNAFKYVFSAEIDSTEYKFMQIVAIHQNNVYVLTYTSSAENYESHMTDVEKTVTEFLFN